MHTAGTLQLYISFELSIIWILPMAFKQFLKCFFPVIGVKIDRDIVWNDRFWLIYVIARRYYSFTPNSPTQWTEDGSCLRSAMCEIMKFYCHSFLEAHIERVMALSGRWIPLGWMITWTGENANPVMNHFQDGGSTPICPAVFKHPFTYLSSSLLFGFEVRKKLLSIFNDFRT